MPRPEEHLSPDRPLADDEAERLAERMAAFATASRLKLLYALVHGELSRRGARRSVGLSANSVSQQLRVLRHLRLVAVRRDGRRMLYRLHDHHLVDLLGAIRHQLEHAEQGWSERPAAPRKDDIGV